MHEASPRESTVGVTGAQGLWEAIPAGSGPRAHILWRRHWEMCPGLGQTPLVNEPALPEGPGKFQARTSAGSIGGGV